METSPCPKRIFRLIRLPVENEDNLSESKGLNMAKILIVDDKAPNREYLLTLLQYAGHHMLEAASGQEALDLVHNAKPGLIIVDIVMPAMDGYEFVRKVRSEPESAQTPVIFYTASYLEMEARQLADMCNVRFIITKPAEPQEILEKVKLALENQGPLITPPKNEDFDREHLRTLSSKLSDKIQELEVLNAELENRVQNRTAELVAANSRLRELNRLKDDFVMIVSHDLRSPVGGIQMLTEVLREGGDKISLATRERYLDAMSDAAGRLIDLINNLIELLSIEAGKAKLHLEEFHLSDVVRDSLKAVSLPAAAKKITVDLDVSPGEPSVLMDRLKLSQVFNTLITNAIRKAPTAGNVRIAVRPVDGEVRVSLTDASYENRPELMAHQNLDDADAKTGFAVGLGIAIVQSFVELHGGRIEVDKDPNHGYIFTVCLPKVLGA